MIESAMQREKKTVMKTIPKFMPIWSFAFEYMILYICSCQYTFMINALKLNGFEF